MNVRVAVQTSAGETWTHVASYVQTDHGTLRVFTPSGTLWLYRPGEWTQVSIRAGASEPAGAVLGDATSLREASEAEREGWL